MGAGIIVVEMGIAEFDGQLALAVHRIARVDCEVQQRIFDLGGIDEGVPQAAADDRLDLHALADRATEHVVHALHETGDVDDLGFQRWRRPKARSCEASFDPRDTPAMALATRCSARSLPATSLPSSWRLPDTT